jgi:uncharacterized protein YecT (DUF1311 family)
MPGQERSPIRPNDIAADRLFRERTGEVMNDVKSWMKRGPLAAMLLFVASHGSAALAMDCTVATSKIDKAICSDSRLSNQDAKLNEDYGEVMNKLSPEGKAALRADQRGWLLYRVTACGFVDGDNHQGDLRCLSRQVYRRDDRLLWLIAYQQAPSPYVFFVRSTYETTPDPSGGLPFWSESSIPQIDHTSPSTNIVWSDVQAWNALIAKRIGVPEKASFCAGGKGDIYREPLISASTLLISVTESRDDQCRGGRANLVILSGQGPYSGPPQDHFMSETHYNIVMMRGDVHELVPEDLFSPGDGWKHLLTEHLEQEVQKQASGHREDWHPSADAMKRVAMDPSNWIFGGDALRIRVNQAALSADEFIGGFTVTIPWSDLQGVLSFKGKRILNAPNR